MKLIFLDIDGVLNGHDFCHLAKSCLIKPECVAHINRVIAETGANIVLSSAWRYMIHGGSQTIAGFEYMLRTHGVTDALKIVGITCRDEDSECPSRGQQISHWLREHGNGARYVVVDDESYDLEGMGHPLVQTDGKVGLTDADADRIIEVLGRLQENRDER